MSLSPTATEMLFAIGAGPQVIAVDDQSNFPADAPKTDLSGFKPNAEAIAAKNPDLVVLSNDTDKIVAQLGKLKIPVYLAPAAATLDDTYQQIADLGTLTGHADRGDRAGRADEGRHRQARQGPAEARDKPLTYYYELDPTLYSVDVEDLHRLAVRAVRPDQRRRRRPTPTGKAATRSCPRRRWSRPTRT